MPLSSNKQIESQLPILAIDIPSGLNGSTGETEGSVIKAEKTLFLGLPKRGFFLRNGWNQVGELDHVNFGLEKLYTDQAESQEQLLDEQFIRSLLPKPIRTRDKYSTGLVVGLAGSPGMPGAAIMACEAAMRSGAGLVRLLHPKGMENELCTAPHELVRLPYESDAKLIGTQLNKGKAAFIGPGCGRSDEMGNLLTKVIPKISIPVVLDADALYWIAMNPDKIHIPKKSVLTPHLGEMTRLLGGTSDSDKRPKITEELLEQCQKFTDNHDSILVLKGAPTFIFAKNKPTMISTRGTPGMATAGSGDVLTGLIAALLAQGLPPHEAAMAGTYLHGIAGELAANELGDSGMIATDIIKMLPAAFFNPISNLFYQNTLDKNDEK